MILKLILTILALILSVQSRGDNIRIVYWVLVSVYWFTNFLTSL